MRFTWNFIRDRIAHPWCVTFIRLVHQIRFIQNNFANLLHNAHKLSLKKEKDEIDHRMIIEFVHLLLRIYGTCVDMMSKSHSQKR